MPSQSSSARSGRARPTPSSASTASAGSSARTLPPLWARSATGQLPPQHQRPPPSRSCTRRATPRPRSATSRGRRKQGGPRVLSLALPCLCRALLFVRPALFTCSAQDSKGPVPLVCTRYPAPPRARAHTHSHNTHTTHNSPSPPGPPPTMVSTCPSRTFPLPPVAYGAVKLEIAPRRLGGDAKSGGCASPQANAASRSVWAAGRPGRAGA